MTTSSVLPRVSYPPFARLPVGLAVLVLGTLLTLTSTQYGYHRDELYFRMLPPGWGYVDQPPLTPLLARAATTLLGDTLWALRVPASLALVAGVVLAALLARELGGRAGAQALAAWGYGTAVIPLTFGHVLLTASLDLVVWLALILTIVRALTQDPRWWVAAGVVTGLGMYNKLLVVVLVAAVVAGLLAVGRWRVLATRWPWLGGATALVLGSPTLVYQATHGWPQLAMGDALGDENSADVRAEMWLFQLVTLGPALAVVAVIGAVWLWRRWPALRCLVVAYPLLLAFTYLAGAQVYYPAGLLAALFAVGCVPVVAWARTTWRRVLVVVLVTTNALMSAFADLPLVPVASLAETPFASMNATVPDTIGWPEYVAQIADAYDDLSPSDQERAVILTPNYGEAGAVHRFGPDHGLPAVYSAHNELAEHGPPPQDKTVVITLGESVAGGERRFASCTAVGELDNGVDVDNEEQGLMIIVCRDPVGGWDELWPQLRHLD